MRCPNCGAETLAEDGICEYCGATLPAQPGRAGVRGSRSQPQRSGWKQVPAEAPPSHRRAARSQAGADKQSKAHRPSTLGDLFGHSAPQHDDRGGDEPSLPRFGPGAAPPARGRGARQPAPSAPRSADRWRIAPDADAHAPLSRPDAPYDGGFPDVESAAPTRRGFDVPDPPPRPAAQSRTRWSAGPLQQFRRQVNADQERALAEQPPSRSKPVDTARRLGRRFGLVRSAPTDTPPPVAVPGTWDGSPRQVRRGPPPHPGAGQPWQAPAPGAGWDFDAAPQSPASGPRAPTPHHLGGAWPGAATDLPWQQDEIPSEIDPDYHDTGRGWSIAMAPVRQDEPPFAGRMTGGPRKSAGPRLSEVGAALIGRLGRYTFNLLLLAIVLALLAIPVSMGLARLAASQRQSPAAVAAKTSHPVPTPYAGYSSYQTGLFSISYPKNWTQTTNSQDVTPGGAEQETDFTSPDRTSYFGVGTLAAVPNDQSQFALQAVARGFPSTAMTNYVVVGSSTTGKPVVGQPAVEIDFTCNYLVSAQHLVTLQGTALLRTQGLTTYVVMYAAPSSQFSSAQGQTFTPMLASLVLDA